jgi:thiamine-monophosphate kinase
VSQPLFPNLAGVAFPDGDSACFILVRIVHPKSPPSARIHLSKFMPFHNVAYYESISEGFPTTVLMASEDQLIDRVRRKFPSRAKSLHVGIGDDAAVMTARYGTEWVVTTDAFLENVHFLRHVHPPKVVGYKALARATSDLAAMGARPKYFLLTLALPPSCTGKWFDDFLSGMAGAARRFGLTLAGGDTTKYPSILANLTVIGETESGRAVLRSGASPGDLICVSGKLGEAELGLRLIQNSLYKQRRWRNLLTKQYWPEPRLALGRWLVKHRFATAMIDTSDGLSTDLGHICNASGVGAKLCGGKIPCVTIPAEIQAMGVDPVKLSLHGGEDYELLFTVPSRRIGRLPQKVDGVPITMIGEIMREKRVVLVDAHGRAKRLRPGGWEPFRH